METCASVGPSPHPVTWSGTGEIISQEAQDSLWLKYQPLPRREASAQELRVQVLLGQLVCGMFFQSQFHIFYNVLCVSKYPVPTLIVHVSMVTFEDIW